ncbi:hypothetical protein VZT92_018209 [Zoarces viviparus]|uniref:Uncharacterized protein n=1 Tax=Zoarces viviparus TaxID=48416 RepID=A0AAW1ELS0_ZOAVI
MPGAVRGPLSGSPLPPSAFPLSLLRRPLRGGRGGGARRARMSGRGCRWTSVSPRCPRPLCVSPTRRSSGGLRGAFGGLAGHGRDPPPPRRGTRNRECEPPSRGSHAVVLRGDTLIRLRPQIRRDNPLNLSILLSGGKETNKDSLSSGERRGKSPAPNPRPTGGLGTCGVWKTACLVSLGGLSPSDRGSSHGRCEAGNGPRRAGVRSSRSRVVWECSPKWVVNSI